MASCAILFACLISLSRPVAGQVPPGHLPGVPPHMQMAWQKTLFVLFEELEYAPRTETRPVSAQVNAWYGGAYRRAWVRARAEQATRGREGIGEVELLYGRLVDPFWDAVVGLRVQGDWGEGGPTRTELAAGFIGLAPYRFEFQPTLFVSERGEVSARLETSYPLLLTQRLIAEPSLELNAAWQAVPRFGIERGINNFELALRVRYEFRREFGPYVGWVKSRNQTATSPAGASRAAQTNLVVGLRLWR